MIPKQNKLLIAVFMVLALSGCSTMDGVAADMSSLAFWNQSAEPPPEEDITSEHSLKDVHSLTEDVMYCKIGTGEAKFGDKWGTFKEKSFTVYKEGRTNIKLRNQDNAVTQAFQVILNNSGQKIIFCPIIEADPNATVSCESLYFIEDDLEQGFRRTLNLDNVIEESAVTCSYNPENLKILLQR